MKIKLQWISIYNLFQIISNIQAGESCIISISIWVIHIRNINITIYTYKTLPYPPNHRDEQHALKLLCTHIQDKQLESEKQVNKLGLQLANQEIIIRIPKQR